MSVLANKTMRTGLWYVALCASCLFYARREQLSWCSDWRFAALREMVRSDETDAEVLFLGSSMTARGVRPSVFERTLREIGTEPMRALNLAVMGEPRHVNYLTLLTYLRRHPAPEVVFLEAGNVDIPDYPHPKLTHFMGPCDAVRVAWMSPYLGPDGRANRPLRENADPGPAAAFFRGLGRRALHLEMGLEALGRGPEDLVRMLYNRARNEVEDAWDELPPDAQGYGGFSNPYRNRESTGEPPIAMGPLRAQERERGWYRISHDARDYVVGPQRVREIADQVSKEHALTSVRMEDIRTPGRYRSIRIYTRLLAELCEEKGIRLVVMEHPTFRGEALGASQVELYEEEAELFRPDREILFEVDMYQDPGHYSEKGAEYYSAALARFLAGTVGD